MPRRRAALAASALLALSVLASCATTGSLKEQRSAGTGARERSVVPAPASSAPGAPVGTAVPPTLPRASSVPATTLPPAPPTTTDPGLLPQTSAEPPTGASLRKMMRTLWAAIVTASNRQAQPLFFPLHAYLQMKTGVLPDPSADYQDRLIAFYRLDLAAYHASLGPDPQGATFEGVGVASGDAAWIPPGDCENLIGYWHLPGVRIVYQQGGAVRSFAVASLISWRGVWYVVHLGPNPRPANVGTVDAPALGPGTPGPPGGC